MNLHTRHRFVPMPKAWSPWAAVVGFLWAFIASAALANPAETLKAEVRRALEGYNYVMKTGAEGQVESVSVSGENGSGSGHTVPVARQENASVGQHPPSATMPQQPGVRLPKRLQGDAAIQALGDSIESVAAAHGVSADRFKAILLGDSSAWVDTSGRLYYVELPPADDDHHPPLAEAGVANANTTLDLTRTFLLHSRPGASRVIYLDFNGEDVTGTAWNSSYGMATIHATAFSLDSDPTVFTDAEKTRIQRIWQRVAEDYSSFDVDVTTEEPDAAAIERSSSSDSAYGTRAIITMDPLDCGCGGIAYVGVFDYTGSYYKPAWVFYDALGAGNEKYVAEAISHEVGHNLGLHHDGTPSTGYYSGHGSGATGWAPIMGVGYYKELTQWSLGEYPGANNQEDDTLVMQSHGATLRTDDAGDTPAGAVTLGGSVSGETFTVDQTGIIEQRSDVDYYVFTTSGGYAILTVDPAESGPNLDLSVTLYAADGSTVATAAPGETLNASVTANLEAGTYYLAVDGNGKSASGSDAGYSDYGSLGQYEISGTLGNANTQPPVAAASASTSTGLAPLAVNFSSSGSSDDVAIAAYSWDFGDGSTASTDANPQHTFTVAGTYTVTLAVTDNLGLTSRASVNLTVLPANAASLTRVAQMAMVLRGNAKTSKANAFVLVTDGLGQVVRNATVTGRWGGVLSGKASAVTNAAGIANIPSAVKRVVKGTFSFTVNGIKKSRFTYTPSQNAVDAISITR